MNTESPGGPIEGVTATVRSQTQLGQQYDNLHIGSTIESSSETSPPGQARWQLSASPGSGSGVVINNLPMPENLEKIFVHGEQIEGGLRLTLSWQSTSPVVHPTAVELQNLPIPKNLVRIFVEGTRYKNGLIVCLRWETTLDTHNVHIPEQPGD
jgi:hypothetical protein